MTQVEVLDAIAEAIRNVSAAAGDAAGDPDARLLADLGLDSLDLVAVIMRVQDRFEIEIDLDEVPTLECVRDLAGSVLRRVAVAA